MMAGIEWAAIPLVVELLGIDDIQAFVEQLITIRNWKVRNNPNPELP